MQHLAKLKKNSEQDVLQLLKAKLKEGEVEYFEHIQTKGEVIYIPELYSHATLNLDDSIGVAMAFS